jgi:hypothetical protein
MDTTSIDKHTKVLSQFRSDHPLVVHPNTLVALEQDDTIPFITGVFSASTVAYQFFKRFPNLLKPHDFPSKMITPYVGIGLVLLGLKTHDVVKSLQDGLVARYRRFWESKSDPKYLEAARALADIPNQLRNHSDGVSGLLS